MPGVTLTLDLGGAALGLTLDALSGALSDLSPGLERAVPALRASIWTTFYAQGRPEKWKPLKPSTVERKGHSIILFETGRMMNSIAVESGRNFIRLSAATPYAYDQQNGIVSFMPARPFLLIQQEDMPGIASAISAHLAEAVAACR